MLTLALALALADAPRRAAARPTPKPATKAAMRAVTVASVEPRNPTAGKTVTVTGSGLDQGNVVLLGDWAPVISERSDKKLVFVAPKDWRRPEGYKAAGFVITPGQPVLALGDINVVGKSTLKMTGALPVPTRVADVRGPKTLVSEKADVSAGAPKSWTVDLEGASAVSVTLGCTGGEAEVSVKPAAAGAPAVAHATDAGQLRFAVTQAQLGAAPDAPLGPVVVTLSTTSQAPVGCGVYVGRTPLPFENKK